MHVEWRHELGEVRMKERSHRPAVAAHSIVRRSDRQLLLLLIFALFSLEMVMLRSAVKREKPTKRSGRALYITIYQTIFFCSVADSLSFRRYLSLHHREKDCNFCLFVPLFDALGGTTHSKSWDLQKEVDQGKNDLVPDFVQLPALLDAPRAAPALAARLRLRDRSQWFCSKTYTVSFYCLRGRLHQTWTVPRYGFQYFIPSAKKGINRQIELAILRADKMGVKVLSLAALNKVSQFSAHRRPDIWICVSENSSFHMLSRSRTRR
jgi:hypothetical protein